MKKIFQLQLLLLFVLFIPSAKIYADSGGQLSPEQAAYDVNYYDLDLFIDPTAKKINGSLLCRVEIVNPINILALDLANPFTVDSVLIKKNGGIYSTTTYSHSNGELDINIPESVVAGDMVTAIIYYNGTPQEASNPPWGVGFVWETTSTGDPWIGVVCESEGADIWWPCKDHPSDEPDSMSMSFTVPDPLVCASNGRFIGTTSNGDNTSTFNWFISTPINNYNVSIYIAEFSLIEDTYQSISGEEIPFAFWVLPEDYNTAVNYMDVFLEEFNFLESICGPFPFGTDKHGWAHAPYWGMEHQTIIAYGHDFTLNQWGLDYIHYHELAHEWWGNLISAKDWADVWIHEGLATYTEALYVEHKSGMNSYHQFMNSHRPSNNHPNPLAPYEPLTASQGFSLNPYSRGASVIHTLRYHLGDDTFFNLLKRWVYPDSTDFNNTNGRLCRILTTKDMKEHAEDVTGRELDAFFDVFFREASFPKLDVVRGVDQTTFTWVTENNVLLDLNVPVLVNGAEQTVEVIDGEGSLDISQNDVLEIDPKKWILMAQPSITISVDNEIGQSPSYSLKQNHPNPFNQSTTITYSLPESQTVKLKVFDMLGNEIATLVNGVQLSGNHNVLFERNNLASGTYFYKLQTNNYTETRALLIK